MRKDYLFAQVVITDFALKSFYGTQSEYVAICLRPYEAMGLRLEEIWWPSYLGDALLFRLSDREVDKQPEVW